MSILDRDNKHLFLEKQDNTGNSFIANVNILAGNVEDILTVSHNIQPVIFVSEHIDVIKTLEDHLPAIDNVGNNINDVLIVSHNVNDVVTCGDNIDTIKTVKTHISNVNKISPFVSQIDTVAKNINAVNTVYNWNVPTLANKIENDKNTVEADTAIVLNAERHASQLVNDAQALINSNTERLEAIEDIDTRMTNLNVSTTRAIADQSLTLINQTERITKYKLDNDSKIEELRFADDELAKRIEASEANTANALSVITDTDIKQSERITKVGLDVQKVKKNSDEVRQIAQNAKTDFANAKEQLNTQILSSKDALENTIHTRMDEVKDRLDHYEEAARTIDEELVNEAAAIANLATTDVSQTFRISELKKKTNALDERITQNSINEAKDIIDLETKNVGTQINLLTLSNRFAEKQLNDVERFSNLSYASVVHTRHIQDIENTSKEEAVASCLASSNKALTDISQTFRITKIYNDLKKLIASGTNLSEETISRYFESLHTLEEISNEFTALQDSNTELQNQYQALASNYNSLVNTNNTLNASYAQLVTGYEKLNTEHTSLMKDHNALVTSYNDMANKYNKLVERIGTLLVENGAILDDDGNVIGWNRDITDLGVIESWFG